MKKNVIEKVVQPGKSFNFNTRGVKLLPKKDFRDAHLEAKEKLSMKDLSSYLAAFLKIPYYDVGLVYQNPFPKELEFMSSQKLLSSSKDLEKELVWSASLIGVFSKEINEFLQLKKIFSNFILSNELDSAEKILDDIQYRFGYSYWLLENRIYLIHKISGLEQHKEYVNEIKKKDRKINGIIKYIVSYISIKIEDNVPFDKYELTIKEALFETEEQKISKILIEYLKFKFLNNSFNDNFDFIPINLFESNSSIIDRYITLVKSIRRLDISNEDNVNLNLVKKLLYNIDDEHIERLIQRNLKQDDKIISLLDIYTVGNYQEFLLKSREYLIENPQSVDLYPLFVKSRIYSNNNDVKIFSENSLLDNILDDLSNLYLSNDKYEESFSALIKYTYIFHNDAWAMQLRGLIDSITTSINDTNKSIFEKMYLANLNLENPLGVLRGIDGDKIAENYFIEGIENNLNSATFNLYNNYYLQDFSHLKGMDLPKYRKNSFLARMLFSIAHYQEALDIYTDLSRDENELLVIEGKVGMVECFIELGQYLNAVKMIANSYIISNQLIRQFPIKKLIDKIEEDEYDETLREDISLSILYDIFSKNYSSEKDDGKHDACEDFLLTHGLKKPSDVSFNCLKEEYGEEFIIYYLRNIAVENVIDNFPVFNNTEEVENERIAICRILSEYDNLKSNKYQDEIKKITHKQMIKRGLEEVEKSKIYVDVEGIKTSLYKTNKENYQRFKALMLANSDDSKSGFFPLEENFDYEGQLVDLMIPTDEKTQLLARIVFDTRDSFVSSSEYGLDGYLSVGIRHGTLSGQLRAPLEQEYLITQKDSETGKYILAKHWQNKYLEFQQKKLVDGFDRFGKTIDNIILKLRKEWIQVRTEKNDGEGLFNFVITTNELEKLEKKIDSNTTYDEFMDKVFEMLWNKTDISLYNIRKKIEYDLKNEFEVAFEELSSFVDSQKENMKVTDIKASIANARTTIQYELEKVSNWFKRNDASETSDYKVELPINIALEWIKNIYNVQKIKLVERDIQDFKLKGRTLKSFSDIAFILFDNIIKHSNLVDEIPTGIEIKHENGYILLRCTNSIDISLIDERKKMNLKILNEKINREEDYQNVKIEGGSGFYKIKKIVSVDMGFSSVIDFHYEENRFNIEIKINTEGEIF